MLGTVAYWLVVVAISLVLVVALILFLESRDESDIEGAGRAATADVAMRSLFLA